VLGRARPSSSNAHAQASTYRHSRRVRHLDIVVLSHAFVRKFSPSGRSSPVRGDDRPKVAAIEFCFFVCFILRKENGMAILH
jgi:hypothetical protein